MRVFLSLLFERAKTQSYSVWMLICLPHLLLSKLSRTLKVCVYAYTIMQIVGDSHIYFFQGQSRQLMDDMFRSIPFEPSLNDMLQEDATSFQTDNIRFDKFEVVFKLHTTLPPRSNYTGIMSRREGKRQTTALFPVHHHS